MRNIIGITILSFLIVNLSYSQNIAITDDDAYTAQSSAMLDVKSTNKGILIPRLTSTQRNGISAPATGLLVFDTTLGGFYFYNGTSWINITSGISSNLWSFDGVNKTYLTNTNNRLGVGTNSPSAKMVVKGDATMGIDQPLFSVVNKNNDTIFAVYDGGVRIYVDDSPAKVSGSKGGFAVGGFSPAKGVITDEYLRVTPDSVRIYINNNPAKVSGSKGGFAVGGYSPAKTTATNYLDLTPDNYFIGHESGVSTTTGKFNSTMGYQAGKFNTEGLYNIFIGYQSGITNLKGDRNTFVGYLSGYNNNLGGCTGSCSSDNTFIGSESGYSNTNGGSNTFIGCKSGFSTTNGSSSVYIGDQAGYTNTSSSGNTYIGYISGMYGTGNGNTYTGYASGAYSPTGNYNCKYGNSSGNQGAGSYNSFFGVNSGKNNDGGNYNVAIGADAGSGRYSYGYSNNCLIGYQSAYYNSSGGNNVVLGHQAGYGAYNATSYTDNVFIGYRSGYANTTGVGNVFLGNLSGSTLTTSSNKLVIDNSNAVSPLIGGDFSVNRVGINRMPTTYTLEVGGTIWANGSTISAGATTWSDIRYKTNITQLKNSLVNISKLNGVTYDWKYSDFPDKNFPNGKQIGVIAQEIEKIYPELVNTDSDGYKSVSYEKLTPVLIEAIKELNNKVIVLEEENTNLKQSVSEINVLKAEINRINNFLELKSKK